MDFDLANQLHELLKLDQLDLAIDVAEDNLNRLPQTDFHKLLNRNLLHLTSELSEHLNSFYGSTIKYYLGPKQGLLSSTFKKPKENEKTLKAIYAEMNGFTINYDRWYIDLFAYSSYGGLEDLDWIADFEYSSEEIFTITGFEDLQLVYQDYMEKEKWKDKELEKACDICELLIILRLQELFREAYRDSRKKSLSWTYLPVLATAHDYDLIYNATRS